MNCGYCGVTECGSCGQYYYHTWEHTCPTPGALSSKITDLTAANLSVRADLLELRSKYEALRTACEALLAANDRFDRVDAMQAIRELLK